VPVLGCTVPCVRAASSLTVAYSPSSSPRPPCSPPRPALLLPQIGEIIRNLDVDQNGQIEWGEFATLMADRWLRQDGETDMELATSLFTVNGDDGMLDVAKMRELLTTLGEAPLDQKEMDQIIALADPKGSGRVSVETFRNLPCWQAPSLSKSPVKRRTDDGSSSGADGGGGGSSASRDDTAGSGATATG
jgi:hypothetical protein